MANSDHPEGAAQRRQPNLQHPRNPQNPQHEQVPTEARRGEHREAEAGDRTAAKRDKGRAT